MNENDGSADPTHEVGPEESDPKRDDCDLNPGEMDEKPHESQVGFMEEVGEAYQPDEIRIGVAHDGLPAPLDESPHLAIAPAFTYENVVCVEDDREYVELFFEEVDFSDNDLAIFTTRSQYTESGEPSRRLRFKPEQVVERWGMPCVETTEEGCYLPVRPLRERCIHYKRQVFLNDDQPDPTQIGHKIVFRNCSARRSVGGAAMSLRDEAVLACDWREPRDIQTEALYLDKFDHDKLSSDAHKVKLPLFGDRK